MRRIRHDGHALNVDSGLTFKAPAYPLLGRRHLDLGNSFFAVKAGIEGVVEMARLSRLPVQHQARRSGGTAITAMEIDLALRRGILVPFIKDPVEDLRRAAELLEAAKSRLTAQSPRSIRKPKPTAPRHRWPCACAASRSAASASRLGRT